MFGQGIGYASYLDYAINNWSVRLGMWGVLMKHLTRNKGYTRMMGGMGSFLNLVRGLVLGWWYHLCLFAKFPTRGRGKGRRGKGKGQGGLFRYYHIPNTI